MEANTAWVNPKMLRWAREQVGLTPEEVAEHSRKLKRHYFSEVDATALRRWEAGEAAPMLEHLETLAEIYVCPVGYFFLPKPPAEEQVLAFRGLAPEKRERLQPLTRQTLRRFLELAKWTASLIEEAGVDWQVGVRRFSEGVSAETLARLEQKALGFRPEIRARWGTPEDAFRWWRRKIESLGVFCFQMPLEPKDMRGASLWLQNKYPFILVNHGDAEAATGRLFTLLHEYAHLITGTKGIACDFRGADPASGLEPLANRFAARMLLSKEELWERLQILRLDRYREHWSDYLLDRIRHPFFVSRDVVAIYLEEMELAPRDFYKRKQEEWEEKWANRKSFRRGRGGRPSGKERVLREMGFSLPLLVARAHRQNLIHSVEIAHLFRTKIKKAKEILAEIEG